MNVLSLANMDVSNKKVLVRVDFNVPLKEDGTIADLMRISETLPTLRWILERGGSVILLSHMGRPKGKPNLEDSLMPCQMALSKLLNQEVLFAKDCLGQIAREKALNLKPGQILLLENLRFYAAEENPGLDPSFAKTLASYGDLYVNDAFAACHRKHASITDLPHLFPQKAGAGFLLEKELNALGLLCHHPVKPFHAMIGGAKVSSKLGVIRSLLEKVDALYIGGAMAFTFLKALGHSIGNSLFEPDLVPIAADLISECLQKKINLFLPEDLIAADAFSEHASSKRIESVQKGIDPGWFGMDIGPSTLASWEKSLQTASSIFWNGPVGVFELPAFSKGTFTLVQFLATLTSHRVVGGGDTAAAVHQLGLDGKFSHISTGGGASLEFIEHGTLPGIEALSHLKK